MNFATLKERQRKDRENWSEDLVLRVHRALSWLDRTEPLVPLVIEIMMDHPETLWGQGRAR